MPRGDLRSATFPSSADMPTNTAIDNQSEPSDRLGGEPPSNPAEPTAYHLVADLLGVGHGGPNDLACRHRAAFREILTRDWERRPHRELPR
jgi:hypothetical protein